MVNEDAVQRTFLIQKVARRRLAIYQNRRPLIRGPREGYRNFSEHRVQAAPRKKQDQTLKFMKHSLIKQTALGFQITQTISPLRTSNPSKSFPTSRKIDYRKKPQSKGEVKTTKVPQTELPLLSVMKIGTLRYSGRGRGGRQPEVKCSILGTN